MKSSVQLLSVIVLLLISCGENADKGSPEKWKNELVETERNFAKMAKEDGIEKAFLAYAAEDAVLMRNNSLVIGKEEITEYFKKQRPEYESISLTWKPDFVDVASSGDLGYTYGKYSFSYSDSTGTRIENTGVFHTVWKRQPDGTWRFVWD